MRTNFREMQLTKSKQEEHTLLGICSGIPSSLPALSLSDSQSDFLTEYGVCPRCGMPCRDTADRSLYSATYMYRCGKDNRLRKRKLYIPNPEFSSGIKIGYELESAAEGGSGCIVRWPKDVPYSSFRDIFFSDTGDDSAAVDHFVSICSEEISRHREEIARLARQAEQFCVI